MRTPRTPKAIIEKMADHIQAAFPGTERAEALRQARAARAKARRKAREQIMRDMGLTKVRGAVSGRVYWE